MSRSRSVSDRYGTSSRTPSPPAAYIESRRPPEFHGSPAPSSIVLPGSGTRVLMSTSDRTPRPWQAGHACPACQGLGVRSEVDISTLVPDPGKTIEEGAGLPWNSGGRRLSMYAAGELGVRLDVPYRSLTSRERDIVLHGATVP